jgi:predicted ATP-grasp superfamily ATP-dependent carboligase
VTVLASPPTSHGRISVYDAGVDESLLILGASVRAAAQSAARAGLRPICGDLFFDADLPDSAVGHVVRSFPRDLVRIAERAPPAPWMYTGGVENYPRVVGRISRDRELFGTPPESLCRVRDPFEVARVLGAAGLLFPECRATTDGLPYDGTWLCKNCGSSGGLRVQVWRDQRRQSSDRGWFFQRRVHGLPMSAVYVAAGGQARMLGATEQLLTGAGDLPFQYIGSIGPIALSPSQYRRLLALGDLLAGQFQLSGLFGVDFVVDGDDVWTIEINPRWTASIEVLERTLAFNAVSLHVAGCRHAQLPDSGIQASGNSCGKMIVYVRRSTAVTADMVAALWERNRRHDWPAVADIPRAGTRLQIGDPVLTVFAESDKTEYIRGKLHALADELSAQFAF